MKVRRSRKGRYPSSRQQSIPVPLAWSLSGLPPRNIRPDWSIVVVCSRSEYERYEKLWQVRTNMGAFTVLNAKRTFILFDLNSAGVKRQDLTLFLLAHELRHVRCMCDLGEGKG